VIKPPANEPKTPPRPGMTHEMVCKSSELWSESKCDCEIMRPSTTISMNAVESTNRVTSNAIEVADSNFTEAIKKQVMVWRKP